MRPPFRAIAAVAPICVLISVATIAGGMAPLRAAEAAQAGPEQSAGPSVSVVPAERTSFTETILVTGSLVPRREVLVSPQIEGYRISELLADEGDHVAKDQVLARLTDETLKAQLAQLEASLVKADASIAQAGSRIAEAEATKKQADAAFARAEDLVKSGSTSHATYDDREAAASTAAASLTLAQDGLKVSQADKTQIEAQIREARLRLGYTDIKAPEAGIISRRTAKIGALASAIADPLFRIIADGEIELDAEVPEIYLPRLSAGLMARIDVASLTPREGKLRLISPEVDQATRLGKVRIFIGQDDALHIGSFARATIDTASKEGLAVPGDGGAEPRQRSIGPGGQRRAHRNAQGRHRHAGRRQGSDRRWPQGRRAGGAAVRDAAARRRRGAPGHREGHRPQRGQVMRRLNISAWSIRNPIPSVVMFIVFIILGVLSFRALPVERFPNIDFPLVSVTITQAGASPSELESQVTKKVENAVAAVTGVKHLTSTITDGVSTTSIEFYLGTNTDRALNDVKDAISRIRSDLPRTIDEPIAQRIDIAGLPIITYAATASNMDIQELSWFIDDTIARDLQAINGVANVRRIGGVDREIRISLNPDQLLALNITAGDVNAQLLATNVDLAGGKAELGGSEQTIRALASATTVERLAATPITLPGGRKVRLDELGEVRDSYKEPKNFARLNGKEVVGFNISRAKGKSDVDVANLVDAKIAELLEALSQCRAAQGRQHGHLH